MADLTRLANGAQRAADVLLRVVGGRVVTLRVPVPPTVSDAMEQIGLAVPAFADMELGPVVFRRARPTADDTTGVMRWELLVSATAVAQAAGTPDTGAAFAMFASAAGVVVDGALLEIEGTSSSDVTGSPYVYRLRLQTAATRLK